jgi:hypothetical protein
MLRFLNGETEVPAVKQLALGHPALEAKFSLQLQNSLRTLTLMVSPGTDPV